MSTTDLLSLFDNLGRYQVDIVKVRRLQAASYLTAANLVLFRVHHHETTARLPLPGSRSGHQRIICSCISGESLEILSESQSLTCFLCSPLTILRADMDRKRRNTIPTNSFFVTLTRKHEHQLLKISSETWQTPDEQCYLRSSSLSQRYFV
jgi:hypothetical protein